MTYEEQREGNRLIMRFMGAKVQIRKNPIRYNVQFFDPYKKNKLSWTGYHQQRKSAIKSGLSLGGNYHNDWNYLIPVFKKLTTELWLKDKEQVMDQFIRFMNHGIINDDLTFAFETVVDTLKENIEHITPVPTERLWKEMV